MNNLTATANTFLKLSGFTINGMKLSKLIYYAHAYNLALYYYPLIEENIVARDWGITILEIFMRFSGFGNDNINTYIYELEDENSLYTPFLIGTDLKLVEKIWEIYGKYTAIELANLAHAQGDPWDQVRHHLNDRVKFITIPNSLIQSCFQKKIKNANT